MSSPSVPNVIPSVGTMLYDSSMVTGEAQQRTRTADPFLTIEGKHFAADLQQQRKARANAADLARTHELARALESADERDGVPPRFPRRYVYFIQRGADGPIKIGYTKRDPCRRMADFQVACPERLSLIGHIPVVGITVERYIHRELAEHRIGGEWFRPSRQVLEMAAFAAAVDGRKPSEASTAELRDSTRAVLAGWGCDGA